MPSPTPLRACLCALLLSASACSGAADGPAAPAAPETLAPETLRADFDDLYAGLQAAHYDLYARRDRADYDTRFRAMRTALDRPLTITQARVAFQRFVAYGNVAHARIDPPMDAWETFRAGGGKAFPLLVRVEHGAAWVIDGAAGLPGLAPGDRLDAVEGVPAMEWLARMRAHVSADNDYMAWAQLERRLPLLVWLELGEVDSFRVVFSKPDGRQHSIEVPARDRAAFEAAAKAGPELFELDWNSREARVLDGGTAYLRPGPFYDNRPEAAHPWDPAAFRRFIDTAFEEFRARGATRLLIDLRDNPGGDNSFSDHMIAWFAERPFRFSDGFEIKVSEATIAANRRRLDVQGSEADSVSAQLAAAYAGHAPGDTVVFPIAETAPHPAPRFEGAVYALVNRHSYSNTVLVAAILQDYGFGTVLGEETADLASTYGAMESFTLPRTGIEVGYPKARILRPNGDVRPRGVIPDVSIATPIAPGTEDEVLARALGIIGSAAARRADMRTR